jgi:hypothetical protein
MRAWTAADAGVLLIAAVLGAGGPGLACTQEVTCTLIGCQDGATLTLRRQGGQLPSFALTVQMDGHTIECPAPPGNNAFARCNEQAFVTTREAQDCQPSRVGDSVVVTCTGTGRFEQILEITGTPASVKVAARAGAAPIAEKTFTPQYQSVQPNGPQCDPTCRQWSDTWELP